MKAVNTRTISLVTTDVKEEYGVNREGMEDALKSLNISLKVLAKKNNVCWDILMVSKEEAKALVRTILTTKAVKLQTECMVTRKTHINLHGVLMFISEDHLRAFCEILSR